MPHNDQNCTHCTGKGKCEICGCQYTELPTEYFESEWFKTTLERVNEIGKKMEQSSNFDIVCKQMVELLEWKSEVEQRISDLETKLFVFESIMSKLPKLMNRTVEKMKEE